MKDGDRQSDLATSGGKRGETSAQKLARKIGISARKIERVRYILDHGDEATIQAVLNGELTINAATKITAERLHSERLFG